MPVTRVQTAKAGDNDAITALSAVFGGSVSSGHLLVVFARGGILSSHVVRPTIADSLGTIYNFAGASVGIGQDPKLWCFWGFAPASGANTVTVTWPDGQATRWVFALEYSSTVAFPGVDDKFGSAGPTDLTSDPVFTTVDETLVLLAVSQNNYGTYTSGVDFTLVDGAIGGDGLNFGGVQEFVTTAPLASYTAHITTTVVADYAILVTAFPVISLIDDADPTVIDRSCTVSAGGGQGGGGCVVALPTIGTQQDCVGGGIVPTQPDLVPSELWWGL